MISLMACASEFSGVEQRDETPAPSSSSSGTVSTSSSSSSSSSSGAIADASTVTEDAAPQDAAADAAPPPVRCDLDAPLLEDSERTILPPLSGTTIRVTRLTADELTVFLQSGAQEIWFAVRSHRDDVFPAPTKMSGLINAPTALSPLPSTDGRTLYYSRENTLYRTERIGEGSFGAPTTASNSYQNFIALSDAVGRFTVGFGTKPISSYQRVYEIPFTGGVEGATFATGITVRTERHQYPTWYEEG